MHDLKSRYDIGWFSAYDTLKGMVVLYGADKVMEALAEITGGLTLLAADGVETCADCKLEYTSSCPSLLGQKCQYFQPRR